MPLSELRIKALKPTDKSKKYADGEGLHLFVSPSGGKLWRLAYRFDGKHKLLSFGAYPHVKLLDARRMKDDAKRALAIGIDPSVKAPIKKSQNSMSFETIGREWFNRKQEGWVDHHSSRIIAGLEKDAFPALGARLITDIEPPEILAVIRDVEDRGAIDKAKRLRQTISSIFKYAIADGKAKYDPAASLHAAMRPAPKVKHQPSIREKELPEFIRALRQYDGEETTRIAVELVLHTFVRTKELRFAKWQEIEGDIWRIPASQMKMGREHIVPLTPQVKRMLARLRELDRNSEWIVPGSKGRPMSENTMLFAVYRMGYHSRLTIHGLRSTASTILNESGRFNSDWIERQLAHVEENKIRGAYNAAEYLPKRAEMMQWWSDYLENISPIGSIA